MNEEEESSRPPLFDTAMLRTYESRLRTQGVPVDEWRKPGLTDDEMSDALAPLGLGLPMEGRVWWGWHNGAPGYGKGKLVAPSGDKFLSLAEAVETYREFRTIVQGLVEPDIPLLADPDYRWNPAWLPIRGPQLPVVIDCSVPEGQPTPLRFIDLQDVEGSPKPRAQSLGQMVSWWIEAIDCGAWRWNPASNQWDTHDELLPRELRTNPLV
jgi:hypothetical protein